MAIDNELSSEIATALLTRKERDPRELRKLKEMVIKIHTTLQQLSADSRRNWFPSETSREGERGNSGLPPNRP
jgi:hypothetical protein